MIKLALGFALSIATAAAFACPDGMKEMDAKAPADQRLAISEQPVWTQPKAAAAKAKADKPAAKPAATTTTTAATKKAAGV
jgi:hypothetical protein